MAPPRRHTPATRLTRLGRDPKRHAGTVNPPVYHASTIIFDTLAELEDAMRGKVDKGTRYYGRYGTETTFALESAIADLEGGYGTIAVPSGLAAITGTLLAFTAAGDHVLMTDSAYEPTRQVCELLLKRYGVGTTYYDPRIGAEIEGLMRPNTKAVFLESPGSLTFEVQDVPVIAAAAHAVDAVAIMDNTWATPLYCRPLALGVDVSIQAGTKYVVGHADAMLGLITTTEAHYKRMRRTAISLGYAVGPDDVYLALRGLRTLAVRMARHQETGLGLARWMGQRPEVARVIHPALPAHPDHALWQRDFTGASGLFSIVLHDAPKEAVAAMLDGLELFGMGVSWGGYESLILPSDPRRCRSATTWDAPGPLLRIHAGLEDADDLIADLDAGFARLRAVGEAVPQGT